MKKFIKLTSLLLCILMVLGLFAGCGAKKEKVIIYTSAEDFRVEHLKERIYDKFPDYNIVIEYMSTGSHAAKLLSEGKNTECDITYDLEYPYLQKLESQGLLADLSEFDRSLFLDNVAPSNFYMPDVRNGGAVIIDEQALKDKGIAVPTSYEDLLKPEYKGLICMPNPKSSGTGFMFLQSLCKAWGEEKALQYFDKLSENVIEFSGSGSGPINKLIQKEAAIGLGMTSQAVNANKNGSNLKIAFFAEGSPYSMYGQGVVAGKLERPAVKEVFTYLSGEYTKINNEELFPEQLYKEGPAKVEGYPSDITYADMGTLSPEEKDTLLTKWKY